MIVPGRVLRLLYVRELLSGTWNRTYSTCYRLAFVRHLSCIELDMAYPLWDLGLRNNGGWNKNPFIINSEKSYLLQQHDVRIVCKGSCHGYGISREESWLDTNQRFSVIVKMSLAPQIIDQDLRYQSYASLNVALLSQAYCNSLVIPDAILWS